MTLSKEWKDGILSIIMRGMSKNFKELGFNENQQAKWVCLDGDIDAVTNMRAPERAGYDFADASNPKLVWA